MSSRTPILLSYYALSNGAEALIFGQITSMRTEDLTFTDFGRRKTFRTLLSLYRTRAVSNEKLSLSIGATETAGKTDSTGFFLLKINIVSPDDKLNGITLSDGRAVTLAKGLYGLGIHQINVPRIVISDIDDTILHSYISRKILKFRTLLFTPVERRRAVEPMKQLILGLVARGATPLYLSNSEQNLYPLIYRFLAHHGFPPGPLFLKQMRRLRDVVRYRKLPSPEVHKMKMIDYIIPFFPEKKFTLVGDNTQFDMAIYMAAVRKYPGMVEDIFIRRVIPLADESELVAEIKESLGRLSVNFHYDEAFIG